MAFDPDSVDTDIVNDRGYGHRLALDSPDSSREENPCDNCSYKKKTMSVFRLFMAITLLGLAHPTWAGEASFSLNISAGSRRSLSPAQEARLALWNDPMIRLMRAMDAEVGHLLIGQPGGGRTPPLISVGVGGGLPPRILSASIEHNLARSIEPPTAIAWPWLKENEPTPPPMEEQLALLLGERLEQRLGSRGQASTVVP